LPLLLERAGAWHNSGSITGLYTVLVEGDDMNEPVADAMRAILDGHIVLRRELAARNHYPAIDVLSSVSRLMTDVADEQHLNLAGEVKDVLATYKNSEDMINIGAYVKGSNRDIDRAIGLYPGLVKFLKQPLIKRVSMKDSLREMSEIFK
jgi:flagellum-specific ATP synthase